jgi:hypothetical protein
MGRAATLGGEGLVGHQPDTSHNYVRLPSTSHFLLLAQASARLPNSTQKHSGKCSAYAVLTPLKTIQQLTHELYACDFLGRECVTSNDQPRIVAYRHVINASIDVP